MALDLQVPLIISARRMLQRVAWLDIGSNSRSASPAFVLSPLGIVAKPHSGRPVQRIETKALFRYIIIASFFTQQISAPPKAIDLERAVNLCALNSPYFPA
jgi:hypothetical protein